MSELEKKDRNFFKQIGNYSEQPPASVKAKIDAALDKKKRRRILWILFSQTPSTLGWLKIAAVIIGIFFIAYNFFINERQPNLLIEKKNETINDKASEKTNSAENISNSIEQKKVIKELTPPQKHNSNLIINSKNKPSFVEKKGSLKYDKQPVLTLKDNSKISHSKSKKSIDRVYRNSNLNIKNANQFLVPQEIVHLNNEDDITESGNIENSNGLRCIDELSSNQSEVLAITKVSMDTVKIPALNDSLSAMQKDDTSKHKLEFILGIKFEIFKQQSIYSSNTSMQFDENALNASEKSQSGKGYIISTGIKYKNWILTSGVKFSQLTEQYKYKTLTSQGVGSLPLNQPVGTAFVYNDTLYGSDNLNNPTLSIVNPINSIVTLGYTTNDTIVTNSYRRYEIPLTLGYQFKIYKKFNFGIHSGISFTWWNKISGKSFNVDKKVIVDYNSRNDIPIRKSGLDYLLSVELIYDLNKNWSALIQPSLAYSLKSMYSNEYVTSRKLKRVAISVGLNYKF